ncbi:MAG: CBS domain-containing protein [Candidatus Melainabacteria bacterium]|nr:CBS domain-containing protein [Candidatus Melainabacteria bacterium]
MEIVLTHNNMDFDSLAAQFAVAKLFAGTRIVPGYPLVGNVREFLSLYRDTLPLADLKYLDLGQVSHIFLVDCQHVERLDEVARRLLLDSHRPISYTIFDHHPLDPCGLGPGAREDSVIGPAGATTTLLVNEIRGRKIKLTPFEATLLTIGIYEDTGCLTYGGTCDTDAECVAYLLRQGSDLARVNDYLHPKLSDEQTKLLEQLIQNSKAVMISGSKVVIAQASRPRYLDGLATLTRKLVEIESADAALAVVKMRDRIHLVGRSDSPAVDIRELLRRFGGDGHAGAGSAVTRDAHVADVARRVEEALREQVKPEKTSAEIMTSPVRTIRPRTTMEEAGRIMLRYGLDGLVVTESEEVVGIVSRRDIDQASHHKLGHAPVQGFMSRPVITISPETPLSKIQHLMVTEDIGRLPVLDNTSHLVGIVTRHEVLKTLYGRASSLDESTAFPASEIRHVWVKEKIDVLDEATKWLFAHVGIIAAQLNMVAYAVGGCVRDLFLSVSNFDLDFVVEGSAIELAQVLEKAYPSRLQLVAKHDRFQTATLVFHAASKREVDVSTARTEFYEFPAALPTVEASGLRQDLFRRDFTINALAICLNPGRFGELIDYFGGLQDLEAKTVRILHPFSFIEDPTRIVRAARFAARLGCRLDPRTRQQAVRAIAMGIFDDLGGVRIRTELKLILESPQRLKALDLLGELGGRLAYLDSKLEYGPVVRQVLRRAERLLSRYTTSQEWVVYLGVLLSQLDTVRLDAVMERLHLSNEQKEYIAKGLVLPSKISTMSFQIKRSEIYALCYGHSLVSLAIAASVAQPGSPLRRMIKLYLEELRHVNVFLSGADLIKMGFSPGPQIGQVVGQLREAKLDGVVVNLDEEIAFAQACLSQSQQECRGA